MKIGVMINSPNLSFDAIEELKFIQAHPALELSLVIVNASTGSPMRSKEKGILQKLFKSNFIYLRYKQFEHRRVQKMLAPYPDTDATELLKEVPQLQVEPIRKGRTDRFSETDIEQIKACELDVIIRFGFRVLTGGILHCARYGVWGFQYGDNDQYRGSAAGFWEVYEGNPHSGITLQVLAEDLDNGRILAKTTIRTEQNSALLNYQNLRLAGVRLLTDTLETVARDNPSADVFIAKYPPSPNPYSKRVYTRPTNVQMIWFLIRRWLLHRIQNRLSPRTRRQWMIGLSKSDPFELRSTEQVRVDWYACDDNVFLADPFAVTWNGSTCLYVEEYRFDIERAHISAMLLNVDGTLGPPVSVIEEPFHQSFPFLFEYENELYMMPEQGRGERLAVYRCVDFPYQWELYKLMFEGHRCVDAVLLHENGQWWLFFTRSAYGQGQNNLYIYYASTPFGPWTAHRQNPVSNSIRGSRMAGDFLRRNGKLIRPAQNCEKSYGGSVIFYEVKKLTPDEFIEEELFEVGPPTTGAPWNDAFHTINYSAGYTLVDGCRNQRY